MALSLTRSVLLAPTPVARAAAAASREPEQLWMLSQPRATRSAYVREVLDAGEEPQRQEIWMLGQPDPVRESYVRDVLQRAPEPPLDEMWMLRQSDPVRRSYVREVVEPQLARAGAGGEDRYGAGAEAEACEAAGGGEGAG